MATDYSNIKCDDHFLKDVDVNFAIFGIPKTPWFIFESVSDCPHPYLSYSKHY